MEGEILPLKLTTLLLFQFVSLFNCDIYESTTFFGGCSVLLLELEEETLLLLGLVCA